MNCRLLVVVHLLVVLATLLQIATCFTARPLFSSPAMTRLFADASDDAESSEAEESSLPRSNNDGSSSPALPFDPQQQPPTIPQQPIGRTQMDPLLASLTRTDTTTSTQNTRLVPLLGEIDVDGSLLVLIPAIVLAVGGFVMSVIIAFNSQDAIVDGLVQLSDDVTAAAMAKTNISPLDDASCRGICSSQETDLQSLKTFMDNISKK